MISLYMMPSIFALALKITIFWFGRHSMKTATPWLWAFFLALFGLNLFELTSFYNIESSQFALLILKGYYTCALASCSSLLLIALHNTGKAKKFTVGITIFLSTLFIVTTLIPNAAISDVKSIGYSITRVAGPFYVIIQAGILVPLIATILLSLHSCFFSRDYFQRRKSQILLIACSPTFIAVFVVMLLMQMGFKINASVIVSITINITLLILIYTECTERQYRFMTIIPKTKENHFVKNLSLLITDPTIGLEKGRLLIEKEMIKETLLLTKGNKITAAKILGVSRQTLHRRINTFDQE